MNVLFLAHRIPYPPNRGDRIRSYNLIRFLAKRGEIDLAYLTQEPVRAGATEHLSKLCRRVTHERLQSYKRWIWGAGTSMLGRTATEGLFWSRRLKNTLDQWTRDTQYDVVFVYCSSMAQYLDIPELRGAPTIIDLVDVDSEKWLQLAEHSKGIERWLLSLEGHRLRKLEKSLLSPNHSVILVTRAEAELYVKAIGTDPQVIGQNVHAVPNGVDFDYFHPDWDQNGLTSGVSSSPVAVFVGALDYSANIDAVTWFCENVWPNIRQRSPNARFQMVGSNPVQAVQALQQVPGVDVYGSVSDIRPYLSRATIVVTPLRIARGIQNKVLEAMAMRKPVVSSPQALEGLFVEHGVHAVCADSVEEWGTKVVELFQDESQRQRLGNAGRQFVEQHHCWDACLSPIDSIVTSIVQSNTANNQLTTRAATAVP